MCVVCKGVYYKVEYKETAVCVVATAHCLSLVLQPLVASTIVNKLIWKRLSVVVWQSGELLAHSKLLAMGMKHPLDNGGEVLGPLCLT